MRANNRFVVAVTAVIVSVNTHAGIFNTEEQSKPSTPTASSTAKSTEKVTVEATKAAVITSLGVPYTPVTPPAASVIKPLAADPKFMLQFERKPNESDADYIGRMNALAKKSAEDLNAANERNIQKMQSLAPR